MRKIVVVAVVVMASLLAAGQTVGPQADGGVLLNNGWTIRPAGQQVAVGSFPMSNAVSENGKYLLVLNAGYAPPSVSVIDIAAKKEVGRTQVADAWLGLAVAQAKNLVYVSGGTTGKVLEFSLNPDTGALTPGRELAAVSERAKQGNVMVGDVALSADAHLLYAANLYGDSISVINLQTGARVDTWKTGRRPYRILVPPGGKQLIISCWGEAALYQHDANNGTLITKVRAGLHPTDMLWINKPAPGENGKSSYAARLFVAAANTNNVYSFGVGPDGQLSLLEAINVATTPMHPLGMTPSALASDEKGNRLYVVCSDANAVAEIAISEPRGLVLGFIPTGWYPTALTVLKDGGLAVSNGKSNTTGFVAVPADEQLMTFTRTVLRNSPYTDDLLYGPPGDAQKSFFANGDGHASPIQHVIYVIKEHGTEDERTTPNLHQLARDYIQFDNFFANADTGAEGQNWASAAIAPDYTVKLGPSASAHRSKVYDFEGGEPANAPPAGYLWNNALQAGISIRGYGQWTANVPLKDVTGGKQIAAVKDPALAPYVDMNYRGFDSAYTDVERAKEFIREWKEFDEKGQAPQLLIVRMPGDAADNDQAVGMLADAVSHSKLWPSTAVFVMESSGQSRAAAWVISPYTHRGTVDHTLYNQMSVLRTMELIVGLRPMTQFDAGARPMFSSFSRQPDTRPYSFLAR
ncbi:MAG TPA: bifunctional YncE family protein/alkaline phosphatase family protein [Bryobacteraceae bacterium]|nr:bifunctional YncE family protein/alkaline phosphatase family protein [Bryobacteraceae bacterium]